MIAFEVNGFSTKGLKADLHKIVWLQMQKQDLNRLWFVISSLVILWTFVVIHSDNSKRNWALTMKTYF
jgi:hypothetical protein